jgi:hypothetical protein
VLQFFIELQTMHKRSDRKLSNPRGIVIQQETQIQRVKEKYDQFKVEDSNYKLLICCTSKKIMIANTAQIVDILNSTKI